MALSKNIAQAKGRALARSTFQLTRLAIAYVLKDRQCERINLSR